MDAVIDVNEADFESLVLKSAKPVLVDFWAPWCGPCRSFGPTYEDAAKSLADEATFTKLNTDDNKDIATRYEVQGIPQVLLFRNGEVADRFVGSAPKEVIAKMLRPAGPQILEELTDENFDERVLKSTKPVFVAFGRPFAGVYRALVDALEHVSQRTDAAGFYTVNSERSSETAKRFTDRTSLFLFDRGEVADRMDGHATEEIVTSMLHSLDKRRPLPEITSAEFDKKVVAGESIVLVDVCAPNSGSYRRAADIVRDRLAGRAQYFKLDASKHPDVVERYQLYPGESCLMLFKDGRVVNEIYGCIGSPYLPEDEVVKTIEIWEKEPQASGAVRKLDPADFQQSVKSGTGLALVYFGPEWMGSDGRIARLARERFGDRVTTFKVEADADIQKECQIDNRHPYVFLFKDGEIVYRGMGYHNASQEENFLSGLGKHITA